MFFSEGPFPGADGFGFNWSQRQVNKTPEDIDSWGMVGVHNENVMVMDRVRIPPPHHKDGSRYEITRANHTDGSGVGAAGANALLRHGGVQWMDLTSVFSRPESEWDDNFLGYYGYNLGYKLYVSDDIAEN